MLRKLFNILLISLVMPLFSMAQTSEFGICIGAANFWGDLGGANNVGRPLFFDLELALTRPALGITYRYNFDGFKAIRFSIFYATVAGSDELVKTSNNDGGAAFRRYRNLKFKSMILEFSTQLEINFLRYEIGRRKYRFAPYAILGFGGFYFNPKDPDSGAELRSLGTEGQGTDEYPDRKPYKLIQATGIAGAGLKYNINENWSIGFEYGHRVTWTDYIDDVSKTYVEPSILPGGAGGEAAYLARRSVEFEDDEDWDPVYEASTEPGQQRGDPADNDHYVFAGLLTLTYTIVKGRIYCPKFE